MYFLMSNVKEIIENTKSIYNDPIALNGLLDHKISNEAYSQWMDVIEELRKETGLKVTNTSSALLPCNSCKIILEAEMSKANTFVERSVIVKKSIISPYFSLFGTFGCVESPYNYKVFHKNSLILGELGEYGICMNTVKNLLSIIFDPEPIYIDIIDSATKIVKLNNEISYVGNRSTLYNQLFGILDLEEYHVIT